MKVSATRSHPSPLAPGRTRLAVTVEFDSPGIHPEELWIELPEAYAFLRQPSANPWAAALLVLASKLNERLTLEEPLDPDLLQGAHEVLRAFTRWFPGLNPIEIDAPRGIQRTAPQRCTASFFSGGVDSFFSALWHDEPASRSQPVGALVSVWGLDIPLDNKTEIDAASATLRQAAQAMEKSHIEVWTNLRTTQIGRLKWIETFGCVLAAIALALEPAFSHVLIPSGYAYDEQIPCGSHAATDHLFSTSLTRFAHDGAGFTRMQKLNYLGKSNVAMNHLRVCWARGASGNCGQCDKCWRTMAALDGLGLLQRCITFPPAIYSRSRLRAYNLDSPTELIFFENTRSFAAQAGADREFIDALAQCISNNRARFNRIDRLERLECLPAVGWLFGRYKRAFVTRKRHAPLPGK